MKLSKMSSVGICRYCRSTEDVKLTDLLGIDGVTRERIKMLRVPVCKKCREEVLGKQNPFVEVIEDGEESFG